MRTVFKSLCHVSLSLMLASWVAPVMAGADEVVDQACLDKLGKQKTQALGPYVGKKVGKAFEAYSADKINEALERLLDIETDDKFDRAYINRFIGYIYAGKEGNEKKSIQYLSKAVEAHTLNRVEHTGALKLLADLQMQEKMYKEAIGNYQQWMSESCTQNANVYVRIAQGYLELKQLDKMIEPADKAIGLYTQPSQNPYILKLSSYYERKKYKESIEVLEKLVEIFPEDKKWWPQLGTFYMMEDQYAKALQTMELAYKQGYLEKESEIKALAQLYATNEIPIKSAQLQEKYIKKGLIERNAKSLSVLANTYHAAKEVIKAADYYGEAAEMDHDADLFAKQGTLYLEAEQYDKAVAALNRALEGGAKNPGRIYMSLTEAFFYQKKFKNAYASVQKAKEYDREKKTAESWEAYIRLKAQNNGVSLG